MNVSSRDKLVAALDSTLGELHEAIVRRDGDATLQGIIDRIDLIESDISTCNKRIAMRERSRARTLANRERTVERLMQAGHSEDVARAQVYGKTPESVRRLEFIAQMRSQGYTVRGFDDAVKQAHDAMMFELFDRSEKETLGYWTRKGSKYSDYPVALFFAKESVVMKHASDELLEFFRQHGRITRTEYRSMILAGDPPRERSWSR